MKLALAVSGRRPAHEAVDLARTAEKFGLAEVWLTEDYCERGAFALAGAVAASTNVIRIGLGVVNPWTRHPMLTAMEAAALAELAPGRTLLGLGASNRRWMQDQLGIPFERPLEALEGAVRVVRTALAGGCVADVGPPYRTHAALAFAPPGPVPLVLGVKGSRGLELAARVADRVLLSALSAPAYVSWARERIGELPVSGYLVLSCGRDHAAARERVRPFVATFLGIHGEHVITRLAGVEPERARSLHAGWLDGRPRADLVTERDLDELVVAGDPDHCAGVLARYAAAGLDTAVVLDDPGQRPAAFIRQLQATWGLARRQVEA